jgi:hypothetical protein
VLLATLLAADLANTKNFSANGLGAGSYLGWAVRNGNNGTANLSGKFPRLSATGAGLTGGSDTLPDHQHQTDIGVETRRSKRYPAHQGASSCR